jgi:AcrR family transcriptional regulator
MIYEERNHTMSPRTEAQWEQMREAASEKILRAALGLFKEKGFHGASMALIARRAGVSKGLAYNYFRSKDDLLTAVVERRFDEAELLIHGFEQVSNPLKKLRYVLDRLFDHVNRDIELYRLYMTIFLQPDSPAAFRRAGKISGRVQSQWLKIRSTYHQIFTELGVPDPDKEVIYFRSLTTGMVAEYIMEPRSYPLDAMKAHVLKKYQSLGRK